MTKKKTPVGFWKKAMFSGLGALLPIVGSIALFMWMWKTTQIMIAPITTKVVGWFWGYAILADIITLGAIISITVFIGIAVNNVIGKAIHGFIERHVLSIIPWYEFLKQMVKPFTNAKGSPFKGAALVQIYGDISPALITGFITDVTRLDELEILNPEIIPLVLANTNYITIFCPTAPNPSSGWIYHMPEKYVQPLEIPVDITLKSIISCGVSSSEILKSKPILIEEVK